MNKLLGGLAVLVISAVLLPAAFAQQDQTPQTSPEQPSASQPSAPQQASPSQDTATPAMQSSTFIGTVVKAGDKYVLKTESMTYQLDDQDKAKDYENKQVSVNGTLDQSTSTLRITDINPVSNPASPQ